MFDWDATQLSLLGEVKSFSTWYSWWKDLRENSAFEHGAFIGLAFAYATLAIIALIQLIRISKRVPQYGWTTQKVFHLLNLFVCILRAVAMAFRFQLQGLLKNTFFKGLLPGLLNDLPGLLFFTTYTLLVLFWAEIYHKAKGQTTSRLRPTFLATNIFVYIVQGILVILSSFEALKATARTSASWFLVLVSLAAAGGFLLYGGRLVQMLMRFPLESRGRTKKMVEVGAVTLICTLCFCLRALFKALSTVKSDEFGLNVLQHPFLNIAFYCFVELIPAAAVLFILRKLPPKRSATPIHATHMQAQADIEAARPAAS